MDMTYWRGAAAHLVRGLGDRAFVRDWLTLAQQRATGPQAEVVSVFDLFPGIDEIEVDLGTIHYRRSNANPFERFVLGALVSILDARLVVEIGTFDGATALVMATNAPEATVVTLDLPPDGSADDLDAMVASELDRVHGHGVGAAYRGTPSEPRITQLYGDSRTFDWSPWYGRADLVYVDACHERDFVARDTAEALRLVRSPGGVIVWDDYRPGWPGVVEVVDGLRPEHVAVQIEGTSQAVLRR